MEKPDSLAFPVGLLIYSAILFCATYSMRTLALANVGPAAVPRLLAAGLGLVSLAIIGNVLWFRRKAAIDGTPPTEKKQEQASGDCTAALTIVLLAFFAIGLEYLGFIIAATLYLLMQVILMRGKASSSRMAVWAGMSAVAAILVYLVFVKLFAMSLPAGLFG
ncbi:MAG: tripartite tricarboxylate transporter TctB family protein [Planctomycetota bacterium]|jgi:uncharacterized membrane protein|nr:tripartite tricarboxylate transporter TctB family protein [Planctomycetota bacterium]